MRIEMNNVGFGDFFLLQKGMHNLIVDCGSVSFHNRIHIDMQSLLSSFVKSLNQNATNDVLITHFHTDHISGLIQMVAENKKQFDNAYIPYIVIDETAKASIMLDMAIYFYTFLAPYTHTYRLSQSIISIFIFLSQIVDLKRVKLLSAGDDFNVDNRTFTAIWPAKCLSYPEKLGEYLKELEEKTSNQKEFRRNKKRLITSIVDLSEIIAETNNESSANLQRELKIQKSVISNLNRISISLTPSERDSVISPSLKYYGTKLFSSNHNSTSIVFHDKRGTSSDHGKYLLMTGDVESDIIDRYLVASFHDRYFVLKAPHHGTTNHFTSNLPQSENILISSGQRRPYGIISSQYRAKYEPTSFLNCTADRGNCETLVNGYKCKNGNCQINSISINL
jgi:ribonuclease BN (tRNA processing enzyme)